MNRLDIARLFLYLREVGQNHGQRVEAVQHWSGGEAAHGTSWCAWWATMVLDLEFQGNAPIPRMGSCQEIRELAVKNGWITTEPSVGDLFLYINDQDHAHHIGIVTETDPLSGIAGNTDATGTSNNGDRVAEHGITAHTFIHLP